MQNGERRIAELRNCGITEIVTGKCDSGAVVPGPPSGQMVAVWQAGICVPWGRTQADWCVQGAEIVGNWAT